MTPPQPPKGYIVLWDHILPPLKDGSYRWRSETDVNYQVTQQNPDGSTSQVPVSQDLPEAQGYFNVEGPRFRIDQSLVAAVFPPRNGHGGFNESLQHVAIARRTLPWERTLDPENLLWKGQQIPPWNADVPWMALLLFEESECTIKQNVAITDALPQSVVQRLAPPQGTQVDTVSANWLLVSSILPSLEELLLLTHVRQVNVEDKELNVAGSDGWFSVVMSNRVPEEGKKYVACLVSLEERSDLVSVNPPDAGGNPILEGPSRDVPRARPAISGASRSPVTDLPVTTAVNSQDLLVSTVGSAVTKFGDTTVVGDPGIIIFNLQTTFILLYSWKFECTQAGTFRELMQGLDVKMFGNPNTQDKPQLTDTGHLKMQVADRAGETEVSFYRGPLVPFQLTRDPLGPYHSADQARRGSLETGGEDISYAAAFECGRLLAAADGRFAQELMRWRREAYKVSARADALNLVAKDIELIAAADVHQPFTPVLAVSAVQSLVNPIGPVADPYEIGIAQQSIGMNPSALQQAWRLTSQQEAAAILGGDAGTLGAQVAAPTQTARPDTTIDAVAADTAGLNRLSGFRAQLLDNAATTLKGE
ncbi:hypothetical protein [Alloacidobacterium sp.]|uniref:hypothetical protein n=1 Tax=Alloacidobacterium sp. TaxID=2951999 RepID=UPI002D61B321|nr:hypothetical protein [Alloacidobacterium sp.]HYK35313.1 hypothetical protein [Alloacidobacterium sp.]